MISLHPPKIAPHGPAMWSRQDQPPSKVAHIIRLESPKLWCLAVTIRKTPSSTRVHSTSYGFVSQFTTRAPYCPNIQKKARREAIAPRFAGHFCFKEAFEDQLLRKRTHLSSAADGWKRRRHSRNQEARKASSLDHRQFLSQFAE